MTSGTEALAGADSPTGESAPMKFQSFLSRASCTQSTETEVQMLVKRFFAVAVVTLPLLLGACAKDLQLRNRVLPITHAELTATPFHAQDTYQCGPAALATVLGAAGVDVTPEALAKQVYLPGRKGSIQSEMIAATRVHGLVPYVLRPELDAVLTEVGYGMPVLVLQNLGLTRFPRWHYAVVVGYDSAADTILLRSGTRPRVQMSRHRFVDTWSRAGQWAVAAVAADRIPVTADNASWLRAAAAFEELGQPAIAEAAYTAATQRWPEQPLAWQALANARYAMDDLEGAETSLRAALLLSPTAAAQNNLAQVLLERGCHTAALASITAAEAASDTGPIAATLAATRALIEHAASTDAPGCTP